jgi:hypothetical protein
VDSGAAKRKGRKRKGKVKKKGHRTARAENSERARKRKDNPKKGECHEGRTPRRDRNQD